MMNPLKAWTLAAVMTLGLGACKNSDHWIEDPNQSESQTPLVLADDGRQVNFLQALEGRFDVIYEVYNGADGVSDTYPGSVDYEWNTDRNMLVGKHDGTWKNIPFRSSLVLGYDANKQSYVMGWAAENGRLVLPLEPVEESLTGDELSVPRCQDGHCSRVVIKLHDNNAHTIRRYAETNGGREQLVLEMICTRI